MARIEISKERGSTVGLWITTNKGVLGLVGQDNMPPYLCFYKDEGKELSKIPVALMLDENGELEIQTKTGKKVSLEKIMRKAAEED